MKVLSRILVCLGAVHSMQAGVMQLEDPMTTLGNWTSVNGNAPTLVTSGNLSAVPYMQLNNGVARAQLSQTVNGNWTLIFKGLHSAYSKSLWVGIFNSAGTQGYGVFWDSSTSGAFSGQGYVTIKKFTLSAQPVWSDTGVSLTTNAASGHTVAVGPLAQIELSRDAASNTLYLVVDGIPKASIVDSSYSSFSRVYVRGNTSCHFDDIRVLTETPPSNAAITAAYNLKTQGGATGNGVTNDQTSIVNAIATAKAQGKALYVPPGVYKHSSTLNLDGISLFGHGYLSVLAASDSANAMVRLTGSGKSLKTVRLTGVRVSRLQSTASCNVSIYNATNYEIRDCYIEKGSGAGIISNSVPSVGGNITNNWVSDTLADGIHLTNGSANITVSNNRVRNPGDDMIAAISKVGENQCSNITIVGNDGRGQPTAGRGITSGGSNNVIIQNNTIHNSRNAGILVTSDSEYGHQAGTGAQVLNNTLINCSVNEGDGHPVIYVSGRTGFPITNTLVSGNTITGIGSTAVKHAIRVKGTTEGVTVSNNQISNINGKGVEITELTKNITISGNTLTNIAKVGIAVNNTVTSGAGSLNIQANILTNILVSPDANQLKIIHVDDGGSGDLGWSAIAITNNQWFNPGGYAFSHYIKNDFPFGTVTGNTPTN